MNKDATEVYIYEDRNGTTIEQPKIYPEVSFTSDLMLEEELSGYYHSSFTIHDFYFTDRLDEFAVIDPGVRALFVDVGLRDLCGVEFLDGALERTGTSWKDSVAFLTHAHDDHNGNIRYCLDKGLGQVYMSHQEPFRESMVSDFLRIVGAERLAKVDMSKPITRLLKGEDLYTGYEDHITYVKDGDTIEVGDDRFEVMETPGHSPDHLCLVEKSKKILFAGDHILDSGPGLMCYFADLHLLKRFFDSFERLKDFELERVFMCHSDTLVGTERINAFFDKIVRSYDKPLRKTTDALEKNEWLTVYELAQKYYTRIEDWESQTPILMSRRIAVLFTYLEYLYDIGTAKRRTAKDGAFEYALA